MDLVSVLAQADYASLVRIQELLRVLDAGWDEIAHPRALGSRVLEHVVDDRAIRLRTRPQVQPHRKAGHGQDQHASGRRGEQDAPRRHESPPQARVNAWRAVAIEVEDGVYGLILFLTRFDSAHGGSQQSGRCVTLEPVLVARRSR